MSDRARLLELADRVEAASGPSRELDAEIFARVILKQSIPLLLRRAGLVEHHGDDLEAPPYSASLDAAVSLVPKGWKWTLHSADDDSKPCAYCVPNMGRLPWPEWVKDIEAATPALALNAAALRALAQEAPSDER